MTRYATGENGDARALGWVELLPPRWRRTRARGGGLGWRRVSEADYRSAEACFIQWRSGSGEEVTPVTGAHGRALSRCLRWGVFRQTPRYDLDQVFASALMPERAVSRLRRAHWRYARWRRPSIAKSHRRFSLKLQPMVGGSGRTRHFRKFGLNWEISECN